jgi:hypothetical protein
MRMRAKEFIISLILGGVAGVAYDSLSWTYHLPYVGLNWLGPLLGADGEKGYDAMLYESMIDFAMAALFVYLLTKVIWISIRRRDRKAARSDL